MLSEREVAAGAPRQGSARSRACTPRETERPAAGRPGHRKERASFRPEWEREAALLAPHQRVRAFVGLNFVA